MSETDAPESVTDPFAALDRGFDLLAAAAPAFADATDVEAVADEVLAIARDDRFESAAETVGVASRAEPDAGVAFLDELAASVQRELSLRGLSAADPTDHMVLAAALQIGRDSLGDLDRMTDTGRASSTLLALGARLHRIARDRTISDEAVREIGLAEYASHGAGADSSGAHPDSVAPLHIRADLRVYGAVLAYDDLDLSVARGASLAAESESNFADVLEAYDLDPTEPNDADESDASTESGDSAAEN